MKPYFSFLIKYFLFWLAFFFLQRILFLASGYASLQSSSIAEVLSSFVHGISYDLSTSAYLSLIPFLVLNLLPFLPTANFRKFVLTYSAILLIPTSFICSSDIGMFQAWGTKLNYRAVSYLAYPAEIATTVSSTENSFLLILLALFQVGIGIFFLRKFLPKEFRFEKKFWMIPSFLLTAGILILILRGGTQTFPMNKSRSYYSKNLFLNLAAMNSSWNILYDLVHPPNMKNDFTYFEKDEANRIVKKYNQAIDTSHTALFTNQRPNIVFIHLESWSAEVIESLGGEKGVAPYFDELSASGYLFTNFYASGFRTEHGLISIHSGMPAQPKTSVIRDFGKFEKLPSFPILLDSVGYSSRAYFGGNLRFANSGPYLIASGYQNVIGEDDFSFSKRSAWGAFDEDLLNFSVNDLDNLKEPFFSYIMTVTSHEPFDEVPGEPVFKGSDIPSRYRNAVHYTDASLKIFFEKAAKKPWHQNTIYILVSDHSSYFPNERGFDHIGRFRIPMLMVGPALKQEFHGKVYEKFASQFDIPATLLGQINIPSHSFIWSKDLMKNHSSPFAYFSFENGFGVATDSMCVIFDNDSKKIMHRTEKGNVDLNLEFGKAYEQVIQDFYLDL